MRSMSSFLLGASYGLAAGLSIGMTYALCRYLVHEILLRRDDRLRRQAPAELALHRLARERQLYGLELDLRRNANLVSRQLVAEVADIREAERWTR